MADFVHHGNQMRLMEKFVDSVYTSMFVQAELTTASVCAECDTVTRSSLLYP